MCIRDRQYTVNVDAENVFNVSIRYSNAKAGGKLYFSDENNNRISTSIALPFSGGKSKWGSVIINNVSLKKGINKIRIHFEKGNFNLNFIEFNSEK